MKEQCSFLVPDMFGYVHELEELDDDSCVLAEDHEGPHLVKGDDCYVQWRYTGDCLEPDTCAEYISCQHFEYWRVADDFAHERIKNEGPTST